jgi:hypothetical protein
VQQGSHAGGSVTPSRARESQTLENVAGKRIGRLADGKALDILAYHENEFDTATDKQKERR